MGASFMYMHGTPGGLTPSAAGGFQLTPTRNLVAVLVAVEPSNRVRSMQTDANTDGSKTHVYQRIRA
jgi:hypothetical protein